MVNLKCPFFNPSWIFTRNYSKDYYKILNLSNDCSTKEIKSSFVKLSKELHPDRRPNDPSSHAKFILINEAYSVLSKPESRRAYDLHVSQPEISRHTAGYTPPGWSDNTFWESRDRTKDKYYEGKSYYGIKGLKRVSNVWIGLGVTVFMVIGTTLQFYSLRLGRGIANEKSKLIQLQNNELYLQKRKKAEELGTDAQLEIIRRKMDTNH